MSSFGSSSSSLQLRVVNAIRSSPLTSTAAKSKTKTIAAFGCPTTNALQRCNRSHQTLQGLVHHHHHPFSTITTTTTRNSFVRPLQSSTKSSFSTSSTSSSSSTPSSSTIKHEIADRSKYQLPTTRTNLNSSVQVNLPPNQRIVSFGDVHGDVHALLTFLETAEVMERSDNDSNDAVDMENLVWNGGDTILVQCGDILDRGAEELACLRVLTSLARQAEECGGQVILLHGNHEALNANGLFQYADPRGNVEVEDAFVDILNEVRVTEGKDDGRRVEEEGTGGATMDHTRNCKGETLASKFRNDGTKPKGLWKMQYAGNQPTRWAAFEPGGWLAEPLYSNMKVSVVIGRTVFVHAGLTNSHIRSYENGIIGMNESARDWFLKGGVGWDDDSKVEDTLLDVQDVIRSAENRAKTASRSMPECLGGGIGATSPVWMRDYSSPSDAAPKNPYAEKMIDAAFDELVFDADSTDGGEKKQMKVERMVMGHTPQSKINAALNGKAWRVDVGASKGVMNGTPEVLEIIHQGGKNGEDIINILTIDGKSVPGKDRMLRESPRDFW